MPEAFFEHQQTPDTTITIFKGMNSLEPDMEIENLMETDILLCLIFLEQLVDGCGDLCRGRSLAELGCGSCLAIPGGNGRMALMTAALAE